MLSFEFDVTREQYNIIGVWESPCGGAEPRRETQVCNPRPVPWITAVQWAADRMGMIQLGRVWMSEVYILPVISKTFTQEDLAALMLDIARADRDDRIKLSLRNIDREIASGSGEKRKAYVEQHVGQVRELMGWPVVTE